MRPFVRRPLPCLVALLFTLGCSSDERHGHDGTDAGSDAAPDGGAQIAWPTLDCDPLVPSYCGFPFPSNVFTKADEASPTGRRVALSEAMMPVAAMGAKTEPGVWNVADGFSPGAAILAHLPGATAEGLPGPNAIAASVEPDSKTILLDAESGELVPHFSEIDRSGADDAERALLIHPATRLRDAARYIVAIRGVRGADGVLPPSDAFAALRDEEPSEEASVESRRGLYRDIFRHLADAGVESDDLQLAWDFTTASRDNNVGRFLHMRDDAFGKLPDGGPEYRIDSVDADFSETIAYRVNVMMKAPLYLDAPGPGSHLLLDDDGRPMQNAGTTYEIPVEILIPKSAATEPAKLMQYGHGLLGSRSQIESGHFQTFCDEYGYIIFGVDLAGMSEEDLGHIASVLASGKLHDLSTMFDRLHQGMLNSLLAMRLMSTSFAADETYGAYVDPERRYYQGISQGGIFGGVYMAVTTDVARGALGVTGQPYNLLLNRSVDFDPFFAVLGSAYPSSLDQQFGLVLVQMLWDRLEPNGYTPYIRENTLPGTPAHEVLMNGALGDHQVTTLGAHVMARSVGAKHLDTGVRDIFGLEKVDALESGSAYVEYDFGLPEDPACNLPQRLCEDPHGKIRQQESFRKQLDLFFRTGAIQNFCEGGVCRHTDLSGCVGGETNAGECD